MITLHCSSVSLTEKFQRRWRHLALQHLLDACLHRAHRQRKSKVTDRHHSASPKPQPPNKQGDVHTVGHLPRNGETPLPIRMQSRPCINKRRTVSQETISPRESSPIMCSHLPARVNCGPLKVTTSHLARHQERRQPVA